MIQRVRSRSYARARYAVVVIVLIVAEGCAGRIHPPRPEPPAPSASAPFGPLSFTATAYCTGTRTAAGTKVSEGIVAADPALVPIGSVIQLSGLERRYNGTYTVMDTGPKIHGRRIDLYVRNCHEATRFGRRSARVSIVRRGSSARANSDIRE